MQLATLTDEECIEFRATLMTKLMKHSAARAVRRLGSSVQTDASSNKDQHHNERCSHQKLMLQEGREVPSHLQMVVFLLVKITCSKVGGFGSVETVRVVFSARVV